MYPLETCKESYAKACLKSLAKGCARPHFEN